MFERSPWKALLLAGLGLGLAGCTNNLVDSIVITPSTQTLSVGQTVQFTAIGYQTHGTHPSTNTNVTTQATWVSSAPSIVSVNSSGLATAVAAGTATVGASMQGFGGLIGSTSVVTVTDSGSISTEPLASMTIDPGSQTALAVNQTVNFIAIGTTGSGATVNLTGQAATAGTSTIKAATWLSSNPAIATVNPNTGIATALTSGSTTISAQGVNPDGTVVIGTATLTVTLANASPEPLVSMALIPGTQTLSSLNQPAQFIAIGTTGTGSTVNLTSKVIWTSSGPTVASINANTGLATALSNGTTAITAIASNPDGTVVTGVGTLTVNISSTAEPLVSLAIVPGTQTTTVVGQPAQFIAIGTTSSGTTVNLTNQTATVSGSTINAAVWGSSSSAVATINPATGLASAVSSGNVAITAQAKNPDGTVVTGVATFSVTSTSEPLVALSIVPGSQTASVVGQTVQYVVIGTTASGATVNLTNQSATIGSATIKAAVWLSSGQQTATIDQTGLAKVPVGAVNGVTVITATANNPDGTAVTATATLTVNISATSEPLVSLTIIPGSQAASVVGQTVQYIVIGTTSTGSTVNLTNQPATVGTATIKAAVWGSSSAATATINSSTGLATAVSSGTVAITAIAYNPDGTAVTGAAVFNVSSNAEPLVSVTIVPGALPPPELTVAGQTIQYIAIGTTSSGATVNLTSSSASIGGVPIGPVVWSSSTLSVATIGTTGIAGSTPGLAVAGITGVTGITAIAYNPDGTAVEGTSVLQVSSRIPEPIVSLKVVPTSQFGFFTTQSPRFAAAQFIAIGTTSSGSTVDLTSQQASVGSATIQPAAWSSSNPQIATAAPRGIVSAVGVGSTAITAAVVNPDGTVVTGAASYTVTTPGSSEPVYLITVSPAVPALLAGGQTVNLTATGTSGVGATVVNPTVVWVSSDPEVATVNEGTGMVTAVGPGVSAITATATNPDGTTATGITVVTVTAPATATSSIASITVIPGTQGVAAPTDTAQFIAIGTTTTGATVNLTNSSQLAWSSSSAQIANIVVSGANAGLATATGQGSATITALYTPGGGGNVETGTAQFSVTGGTTEQYTAVTIIPNSQTLSVGQTNQFIALGTLGTSGLMVDVTSSPQIKWSSSVGAGLGTIASINASGAVTGVSTGAATITAELGNPDGTLVSSTAAITVSQTTVPEPLLSLVIVPGALTVGNLQDTGNFLAIGTFSTVPYVRDLTNDPNTTWISSFPESFPVNTNSGGNSGASAGTVTAYGTGVATIIAETKSADGTIQTATTTFSCPLVLPDLTATPPVPGSCFPGSQASGLLVTLTIYNEGVNNSNWLITAPSATNTPDVLHCGPGWGGAGGSVCTATYPLDTTVVLTATQTGGGTGTFGGWSFDCTPSDSTGTPLPGPVLYTATGPNYCAITLGSASVPTSNVTIGAIFN